MIIDVRHFFMHLLAICKSLWRNVHSLLPILIDFWFCFVLGFFFFLLSSYRGSLCNLDIDPLSDM